jgi:hypothetical protein
MTATGSKENGAGIFTAPFLFVPRRRLFLFAHARDHFAFS